MHSNVQVCQNPTSSRSFLNKTWLHSIRLQLNAIEKLSWMPQTANSNFDSARETDVSKWHFWFQIYFRKCFFGKYRAI